MARFSDKKKEGKGMGFLGFLQMAVAATMGCFFGCLRMKDSRSDRVSPPKERMASRNKNALSSLFLSDELEDYSDQKKAEDWKPLLEEGDFMELKDEAKFLKACGTLLETPVEIRKISGKWADTSAQNKESSNVNSWIPSASTWKLQQENQLAESSTPVKISEEWVTGADSLVGTPSSCISTGHNTRRESISAAQNSDIAISPKDVPDNGTHSSAVSSVSSGTFVTTVQRTNKSVRFQCQSDGSMFSSENSSQHSKQSRSAGHSCVSKPSPYPTPLKLTDEMMQTPGTVFPAYMNNIAGGKATMIRSQYVYSKPIEYHSQWIELMEEKSDSNHYRKYLKPNGEATLSTTPKSGTSTEDFSVGTDRKDEPSLSPWLNKTHAANQDGNNQQFSSTSGEEVHYGRSPGDRPILGMVAAHWNDEEDNHISPKWWGRNGIPNSTTKYKEDQKVSWHATPFEERLEKALSEDTFISQRKRLSGTPPFEFDETEESDTASSQLQSSSHRKSVVSF